MESHQQYFFHKYKKKFAEDFSVAQRKLRKAQGTSDLSSAQETPKGRGFRKISRVRNSSSESSLNESENESDENSYPVPPFCMKESSSGI